MKDTYLGDGVYANFDGYAIGKINGEAVAFTLRHDSDSPEMPTEYPAYHTAEYLGVLDNDNDLDYSQSWIEEYPTLDY